MHQVKIYNKISEIKKECWDSLTENNIFMCYNWLKTFEETAVNSPQPYYITIAEEENIFAASVCYFETGKENQIPFDTALLGRLKKYKIFRRISFLPAVICGSKRGYGTHFIFCKEINEQEIIKLYNQLVDVIENISIKHNASICFSNVMESETLLIKLLMERGYYKTETWPLNYIDIIWSSFKEYRKYLGHKYSRMDTKISNEINKNRRSGVNIQILSGIAAYQQRLWKLLEINHKKYNENPIPIKQDYFTQLKENFGDDADIYAALNEEEITGTSIILKKNKVAVVSDVGVDHDITSNDFTYFNIAFYEPIRNAIAAGIKRIYGGNGLYETKARRGFSASNCYIFYKSNLRLKNLFIKTWFFAHYSWMKRKFSFVQNTAFKTFPA